MKKLWQFTALAVCLWPLTASIGRIDARMFRYPDVSATQIAFVYAGDIWVAAKTGGMAYRLSSPAGEEMFPRFSPDGSSIAYSANYDGNQEIYCIPTSGGDPVRITHHPMTDRIIDWYPDGKWILFASGMESGRQRFNQFFKVRCEGGLPEKLPVPYGEFAAFSPDGKTLAYMPQSQDFRTWKRYRGGWAPDIWLFNLVDLTSVNITRNEANDSQPMWHDQTIYFLCDRGNNRRANIWAHDLKTGTNRQVTDCGDYDITFPAIGPEDIVYQKGGRLYRLELPSERIEEIRVEVVTDRSTLKPRITKTAALISQAGISPTGQRAFFQARGDIFSMPAEKGPVLNVTRSPGIAERSPAWSPDGRQIAYWSDRDGEYELMIRPSNGQGEEQKVTSLGRGYRYPPYWSPDNSKIGFLDETQRFCIYDLDARRLTVFDTSEYWLGHGGLSATALRWSADSRWLAYSRPVASRNNAVFLYDARGKKRHQLTSGYQDESAPVFSPDGKMLYFFSRRSFSPLYSDFDNSWIYSNSTNIVAVPLRKDAASPLAPRNDMETVKEDSVKGQSKKTADEKGKEGKAKAKTDSVAAVQIDLADLEGRVVVLPVKAGNFTDLYADSTRILYRRLPATGSGEEKSRIMQYDLKERKEATLLDDAGGIWVSRDCKKMLVQRKTDYAILDTKPDQKFEKPLRIGEMESTVDPRAEWRQIFNDVYRFERDFFYDPRMHGVNWDSLRAHYSRLLDDAVTRWDVNFVIGEFIAELNSSHTYRGGGDVEKAAESGAGLLGADWSLENGAYRIRRIIQTAPWDSVRSPLRQPGVDVKEGDYVLAVNGIPLGPAQDPWAAFAGLAGKTVYLSVNSKPILAGARQVLVETLGDETQLRYLAWVETNRQLVEKASGGRIGYLYVQSTGIDAQNELVRQFMAQWYKEGLIIDERFNSGGQIPDRFVELLNRPILCYWAVRYGEDWQWPPVAHPGPKAMLINGWSGSGGDAFPFYFKEAGLGPLIGTRTWGGLIGISGSPDLIDGGDVTVPTFRMYDKRGVWFREGHGVDPDILVTEDPGQLARGKDTQLDRAIEEVMSMLGGKSAPVPARPAYERR